jgi:hypothetical protein
VSNPGRILRAMVVERYGIEKEEGCPDRKAVACSSRLVVVSITPASGQVHCASYSGLNRSEWATTKARKTEEGSARQCSGK